METLVSSSFTSASLTMVKSKLESGTFTIENKRTKNSAWLRDDDEDRCLQAKPNDSSDKFKVRALSLFVPTVSIFKRYFGTMSLLPVDCG